MLRLTSTVGTLSAKVASVSPFKLTHSTTKTAPRKKPLMTSGGARTALCGASRTPEVQGVIPDEDVPGGDAGLELDREVGQDEFGLNSVPAALCRCRQQREGNNAAERKASLGKDLLR